MTRVASSGFVRMTNQRRVIIDVLKSTDSHPTAEWVYGKVRETLPNISLATVYSNLRRLVAQGKIRELHCGANQCRYDIDTSNHAHFFCHTCDRVFDLPEAECRVFIEEVGTMGFEIASHCLQIFGTCPDCKRNS